MNPRTATLWKVDPDLDQPALVMEDLEADVIVIGAGITGLTAALRLAEAGRRVVVLEARTVASGATAATTAHVTEAIDVRYAQIAARFGRTAARLVAGASRAAIDHIVARVDELGMDCGLRQVAGYLFTEDAHRRDEIVEEQRVLRAIGIAAELDPVIGIPFLICGALKIPNQLRLRPIDYVHGLLAAARDRGVVVHEHCRVAQIADGEPVSLVLENGVCARARDVICATHVPLSAQALQGSLAHFQTYVTAFADYPCEDALFWDNARPYHYLRMAEVRGTSYLLVGGADHRTGCEDHTEIAFERLLAYARARFGTDRPTFHWSGQVVESEDGLPLVGRENDTGHVHLVTGLGGNGMTFGTVGALTVADQILGRSVPWSALFDPRRFHDRDSMRRVGDPPPDVTSVHEIEIDQGRTIQVGAERLAVYRDRGEQLHAVQARCTHRGCVVHFNVAERTWDCPCHGSRFGIDGEVLDGPATAPLLRRSVGDREAS
jgi:glycine/D-amino acid oxidase-like deaminating enzyme/nitrite reductase/ring-hydroxylating ferredoxin subunit